MKASCAIPVFLCLFFFAATIHAESFYFTFDKKDAEESLKKDALTLTIDKKQVPLNEFFVVDGRTRTTEILQHPAGRRQYLFVYDLVFTSPQELLKARKANAELIAKLGKEELAAIAGISKKGIHLFSSFTTDQNKLIAGLNAIGLAKVEGVLEGPEGNFYSSTFLEDADAVQMVSDQQFLENIATYFKEEKKKEDQRPAFLQNIGDLAYQLSTVEGRKEIIFFSTGFDTAGLKKPAREIEAPQFGSQEDAEELGAERLVPQGTSGPSRESTYFDIEAIAGLAAGADCSFHILSFSEKRNNFYQDLTKKTNAIYIYMEGMKDFPDASGVLDRIRNTDGPFYVIGWSGNSEKEFKDLHLLKIKAGQLEVSREWLAPPPVAQSSPFAKKLNIAEAIYKDYEKSSYAFWADFLLEEKIIKIPTFVQIPGQEILKGNSGKLALDFYSFIIGTDGALVDFGFIPVSLDLDNKNLSKRISESGIKVWNVLMGRPGTTTVRWIIMNRQSGQTIVHSEQFKVDTSSLVMSHPFFPALNLNWVLWPMPKETHTRRGSKIEYPYKVGPDPFFPDLDPACSAKEAGRVFYLRIYNKPEGAPPPIELHLVNEKSESFTIDQFGLMQKPNDLPHSGMEVFWKIGSFPPVNPGPYRLVVALTDRVQQGKVTEEIAIDVTQ